MMLTSETLAQVAHQNVAASMATVDEIVAAALKPKRRHSDRMITKFFAETNCRFVGINEVPRGLV